MYFYLNWGSLMYIYNNPSNPKLHILHHDCNMLLILLLLLEIDEQNVNLYTRISPTLAQHWVNVSCLLGFRMDISAS